jgi:hypothetical protein
VRPKHVAVLTGLAKFIVADGSPYVNFHRLKLHFNRSMFLPWISSDRPKSVLASML